MNTVYAYVQYKVFLNIRAFKRNINNKANYLRGAHTSECLLVICVSLWKHDLFHNFKFKNLTILVFYLKKYKRTVCPIIVVPSFSCLIKCHLTIATDMAQIQINFWLQLKKDQDQSCRATFNCINKRKTFIYLNCFSNANEVFLLFTDLSVNRRMYVFDR